MKKIIFPGLLSLVILINASAQKHENVWRELLNKHANCVTWVSVTVKLEISAEEEAFPTGAKT